LSAPFPDPVDSPTASASGVPANARALPKPGSRPQEEQSSEESKAELEVWRARSLRIEGFSGEDRQSERERELQTQVDGLLQKLQAEESRFKKLDLAWEQQMQDSQAYKEEAFRLRAELAECKRTNGNEVEIMKRALATALSDKEKADAAALSQRRAQIQQVPAEH
jgi:hypothetical protein